MNLDGRGIAQVLELPTFNWDGNGSNPSRLSSAFLPSSSVIKGVATLVEVSQTFAKDLNFLIA